MSYEYKIESTTESIGKEDYSVRTREEQKTESVSLKGAKTGQAKTQTESIERRTRCWQRYSIERMLLIYMGAIRCYIGFFLFFDKTNWFNLGDNLMSNENCYISIFKVLSHLSTGLIWKRQISLREIDRKVTINRHQERWFKSEKDIYMHNHMYVLFRRAEIAYWEETNRSKARSIKA